LSAPAEEASQQVDWSAEWIAPKAPVLPGQWVCFRKRFKVTAAIVSPRVRIACDSKYWLWINGKNFAFEGQLKRGPNPSDTYFDELDLPTSIGHGENVISLLVWYFGRHGFAHQSSGKCGLVFELFDRDRPLIRSDRSWRAMLHPAYGCGDEPVPNFRLAESNICFDARKEPLGWRDLRFDDFNWPLAQEFGRPPAAPWNRLVRRPIPMWRDEGLVAYDDAPVVPFVSDGQPIICKLPGNIHVTPELDINASAGTHIDIRTDNYTGGGANNVRAEYVSRAGRQSYESLGWMNGHEVHYRIPAGVTVHGLRYRRTSYNTQWLGAFDCDHPPLVSLWKKSIRTLDVCMRDSFMDCPDRERAQWWGDVVIQSTSAAYACDAQTAPLLTRKGIIELFGWQKADGALYSPIPAGIPDALQDESAGCWDKEIPSQMLASIGLYGLWAYYEQTGDREIIAEVFPGVLSYLAQWHFDEKTGLVEERHGGWNWVDWGSNVDSLVCVNAWYALALRGVINMARLLERSHDASLFAVRLERMHVGFNAAFWNGEHYMGTPLPTPDDRAAAMAVLAGFVDQAKRDSILALLARERHAGPYMEKYIVEALFQLRQPALALQRLMSRYAEQIAAPTTTLWEGWSVRDATWGGGTYNHAWSAGSIALLQQYVAGITPVEPAFRRFAVRPQLAHLSRVASVVPTRFGLIRLIIDADERQLTLEVPPECQADLTAPGGETIKLGAGIHHIVFDTGASQEELAWTADSAQESDTTRLP